MKKKREKHSHEKEKKVMKKKKQTGRAKYFLQLIDSQVFVFLKFDFSSNLIILGTGTERETYLSVSLYKK